jgi:glycosyltransferase involved in cell wall biosynthesis
MKITLVTETYYPQVNGVSRTLGELVRHMKSRGDQVQLIQPDYGKGTEQSEHGYLVPSWRLPFYNELYLPLPPFQKVYRAIEAFGPDIVHIATEATLGLSMLRFARKRRYNTVSSFHTNFDQYSRHYNVGWAKLGIRGYLRWFHNQTRETYVPSEATIAELSALGFERLVLWKRGVDSALFRPDRPGRDELRRELGCSPDDLVISYVSRIAPEKNVEYLASAFEIVAAQRPSVKLLLVGDGPTRPTLEKRLGASARFVGYRRGEDLANHYSAADLFAFASLTETFGNVVLEAMASGLPVVALAAGGVGEIVHSGSTGVLVDPNEPPAALASALILLIDQPEARQHMARAARAYAESQSWDAIMGKLRDGYEDVINDRAGGDGAGGVL